MSTGGTVSLRLSMAGLDQVKASLAGLGPVGASALKQIEQAQQAPTAGMKALNAASHEAQAGLQGLAGSTGSLGSILTAVGPAGLAAAAGIGAIVAIGAQIGNAAKGAIEFGASIDKLSKTTGISTTFLQQLNYAAKSSNIDVGTADAAIKSLNDALGAVNENLPRSKQLMVDFSKLGFTREQLVTYSSAAELFPVLAQRMADMQDVAGREAIAKKLGLEDLLPLLTKGSTGFQALADKAKNLNLIMDPGTVQAMGDAKDKLDSINATMEGKTNIVFANFAGTLVAIKQDFLDATNAGLEFLAAISGTQTTAIKLQVAQESVAQLQAQKAQRGLSPIDEGYLQDARSKVQVLTLRKGLDAIMAQHINTPADVIAADRAAAEKKAEAVAAAAADAPKKKKTRAAAATPTADEYGQGDTAEIDASASDLIKARKGELEAQLGITKDATARAAIQAQINALDNEEAATAQARKDAEAKDKLDRVMASKTATAAEKRAAQAAFEIYTADEASAKAANGRAQVLKDDLAARTKGAELIDQQGALDAQDLQSRIDLLKSQAALTENAGARKKIEQEIYDLDQRLKKMLLETTLKHQLEVGDPGAALTQKKLDDMAATAPADREAYGNANAGPLQKWTQDAKTATDDVGQDFQTLITGGLDKFNSGLFDSEGRLNSLQDVFRSTILSMIASLEQFLLKQAEIGVLGAFGGGGSASGGGFNFLSLLGIGGGGGIGAVGASSATIAAPADLAGLFADGGRVVGPGGPRSDSILAAVSHGEFIINAHAADRWGPVLQAINENHPMPIPRFAGGGMVGGGNPDWSSALGPAVVHLSVDRSIHAPGADAAALQRVANNQEEILRGEPRRWVQNLMGAKKAGLVK